MALDSVRQDVRDAFRVLRSSPAFSAVAIVSLALGIGANTAIFSLIDSVMLRYLPVNHPEELVEVGGLGGYSFFSWWFTNPRWEALRERQQVFAGVFAFGPVRFNLSEAGEARHVQGAWVSGEYFTTLGVHAAFGRTITPADDQRGCRAIAVLSYDFWQSAYGARRDVLGRTISLDGYPFEIVGVVQPGFSGLQVGDATNILAPLCTEKIVRGEQSFLEDRRAFSLHIFGRPKPGLNPQSVDAELKVITPQVLAASMPTGLKAEDLRSYQEGTLQTAPAGNGISFVRTQYRAALLVLMAAVGLVLLIACANVANLLVARTELRQREIAIRMALGAGRSRLMRKFLTESLLLSLSGAALGILFARWGSRVLLSLLTQSGSLARPPLYLDLGIDMRVLIFTLVIAVGTGLLFGIAPAWRGTRANPQSAMKASARGIVDGHSKSMLGRSLVIFQVALSLVLATGAGLMAGTFRNLASADMGFNRKQVLLVSAEVTKVGSSPGQIYSTLERARQRLAALPGVLSASFSDVTPISGVLIFPKIEVEGFVPKSQDDLTAWTTSVSQGYFETMDTLLLAGRDFDGRDVEGAPLSAIVNEAMAKRFFGGTSPIGRYFRANSIKSRQPIQIVGVAKDAKYFDVREVPRPTFYTSMAQVQRFDHFLPANFEVHTAGRVESIIPGVKSVMAEATPATTFEFKPLALQISESLNRERLLATLSGFFGGLALLLAAIGLYGVMSYGVARRRNEIGIRMALGAEPRRVLQMILQEVSIVIAIGIGVGFAGTLAAARLVTSLLYGVSPNDPFTTAFAASVLSVIALLAGYLPARRASHLDPMAALREE